MCRFFDRSILGVPDPRFAIPGASPQYPPDRDFKTEHTKLELAFDIDNEIVSGKATIKIRTLVETDRIILNAASMKIKSVKLASGKALSFEYDNEKITINTGKTPSGQQLEIVVEYEIVKPRLGVYFVQPDKAYPKKPVQVWTHGETSDARYWFPCHDEPHEKATMEMLLTVPEDFFALSNGVLVSTKQDKKAKTYHWRMNYPMPSYLAMLAVGRFAEIKDEWKGVAVTYYCEKGREADARRAFGKTPNMLEFFSNTIGVKYPYDKYAQVAAADFIFGGMEHTTATTQTDLVLHDERAHEEAWHDGLVAHELAHQWFGDLLTCKSWPHAWLNESFATYFDALFTEHDKGKDEFLYQLYGNAKTYFSEDQERYRRPLVTNIFIGPEDIFDRHLYEKGSLILHMLRNILGDAVWWKCIKYYVEKNANRTVETTDFISAIEEASGRSVRKFFDQWIYGAGHPELKANYYWDDKAKEAVIRVSQSQRVDDSTPLYSLPLTIEIITKEGQKRFVETLAEKQKQFRYKMASEPLDVRIDADNVLLKKMEFIKPKEMWLYQLANDQNAIGRIAAAQELAKISSSDIVTTLEKQFDKEKFWGVQAEIAASLATMKIDAAVYALEKMAHVKSVKARRAVAEALGETKNGKALDILTKLLKDRSSYCVPAEAARSIGKVSHPNSMKLLKENLAVDSWNDTIRSYTLSGISQLQTDESVKLLKKYSEYGNHSRCRMTAIRALGAIGRGRKDVLDALIAYTEDKFSLVQMMAVISLGDLKDERAVPVLQKLTKGDRDSRIKRQALESIRKIYTWLDTDLETAQQMEKMKKESEKTKK